MISHLRTPFTRPFIQDEFYFQKDLKISRNEHINHVYGCIFTDFLFRKKKKSKHYSLFTLFYLQKCPFHLILLNNKYKTNYFTLRFE